MYAHLVLRVRCAVSIKMFSVTDKLEGALFCINLFCYIYITRILYVLTLFYTYYTTPYTGGVEEIMALPRSDSIVCYDENGNLPKTIIDVITAKLRPIILQELSGLKSQVSAVMSGVLYFCIFVFLCLRLELNAKMKYVDWHLCSS